MSDEGDAEWLTLSTLQHYAYCPGGLHSFAKGVGDNHITVGNIQVTPASTQAVPTTVAGHGPPQRRPRQPRSSHLRHRRRD